MLVLLFFLLAFFLEPSHPVARSKFKQSPNINIPGVNTIVNTIVFRFHHGFHSSFHPNHGSTMDKIFAIPS
jgi:hypothetical protein